MLTEEVENLVCAAIVAKCRELGCRVIALNAVVDHVHLLVEMPPALPVSKLVAQVKGVSSHLVRHRVDPKTPFQWSGTYAAFTVDGTSLEPIAEYLPTETISRVEVSGDGLGTAGGYGAVG